MANFIVNGAKMCEPKPFTFSRSLEVLSEGVRNVYFWTILPIVVIAVILNLAAIISLLTRKCKFLQKLCTISLALSDLLYVVLIGTQNMTTLSHSLMVWTLGEFLCHFLPMMHILLTTINSIVLVTIALDRYQSVCYALSKKWDPKPVMCLTIALVLLIISSATAFPMYHFFEYKYITVLFIEQRSVSILQLLNLTKSTAAINRSECMNMCIALDKDKLTYYYGSIFLIIFLPIFAIFFWFYYNIATLIWKHRKPIHLRFNKWQNKLDPEDDTSTTKTTNLSSSSRQTPKLETKKKSVQVKKKIRTFRIVVALMVVFIGFRAPYWVFYFYRLYGNAKGDIIWTTNFTLVSLSLFNCILNPLLYTFLKQTVNAIKTFNEFFCIVCCWCFSNDEFKDFGKDNPFIVDNMEQRSQRNDKKLLEKY